MIDVRCSYTLIRLYCVGCVSIFIHTLICYAYKDFNNLFCVQALVSLLSSITIRTKLDERIYTI